jgi:N6-L-threonylcarbamoyladenine synthase
MILLCIETSCDETAAAVVRDGRQVLSSIVASQVAIHANYGGVVPEIASRKHLESVGPVVAEALRAAEVSMDELEGVAVTRGPGLIGALLVGVCAAKGIALGRGIPLVGVHHIESHLLAVFLEQEVAFPFVALAVSGGHSHLYLVEGIGHYRTLGQTLDDAAGEAFDKVAKLLGIPYPGGAVIDRLAQGGDPRRFALPRPLLHDGSLNFSFSGLKTAVLNLVRKQGAFAGKDLADLCASFQAAACEVLCRKAAAALAATGCRRLVVAGGVACNSGLRRSLADMARQEGVELFIPAPTLCADNAAMLAVAGDWYLSRGQRASLALDALPTWQLDSVTTAFGAAP